MKTIYIANDGMQFDNEFDCEMYEMRKAHPHCETIEYFDKTGKPILAGKDVLNMFEDIIYDLAWKVIIHNEEEFNDFCWLCKEYNGWCEMEDITGPGVWNYIDDPFVDIKFVKEN